ncbi:hypothetical protein [Schlesneria paludicola]|uniref:hypothetical protein n=1 Tax=Schlesneria paludicola TaxID=360056 RepID=UPI0002F6A528|nr:hypothetical protein [Schlesneria paludicola]
MNTPGSRTRSYWIVAVGGLMIVNFLYLFLATEGRRLLDRAKQSTKYGLERGFINKSFIDDDGIVHRYIAFVPYAMTPHDQLPLMLYLNGHGKNGSDGIAPLIDGIAPAIWERTHSFPFVVVWPQCPENSSWVSDQRLVKVALGILDQTAAEYHTDPDRVYLSGLSSGGAGVWSIAAEFPHLFAAIVPISAGTDQRTVEKIAAARLPVWMFSVAEDAGVFANACSNFQSLLSAGLSARHSELRGQKDGRMDLHDAWSFAYRNCALYRWLLIQNRAKRVEGSGPFELVRASEYPSQVASIISSDQAHLRPDEAASVSKKDIGPVAPTYSAIPSSGLTEFHFEFRSSPEAERFSMGFFPPSDENSVSGSTVNVSLDGISAGGVYSWPNNRCVCASSPEAEHALVAGRWNDLRLQFTSGRISVELNGWSLLDGERWVAPNTDACVGFVVEGKLGACVEIRNLRVRYSEQATLTHVDSTDTDESHSAQFQDEDTLASTSVEVTQIARAWKRREELFPHVQMQWTQPATDSTIASAFRATVKLSDWYPSTEKSRLVITPSGFGCSTPWLNSRIDFSRATGFSGTPIHNDFLAALNSRFSRSISPDLGRMRLDIVSDAERRCDEILDGNDRGRFGIIFDRPNPWCDRVGDLGDLFWRGPILAFRPFSPYGIDCDFDRCEVLPKRAWVDGVPCLILEERTESHNSSFMRRFWVDPQREFLILKTTTTKNRLLREQVDIKYAVTEAKEWLPSSWTAVSRPQPANSNTYRYFSDNDQLFEVASATVVDCKLNETSGPIQVTDFRKNAIVFDQKDREWFQQVAPARRRKLTPGEVEAITFGERLTTSGTWFDPRIGAGIAALCAGWGLARYLRPRR